MENLVYGRFFGKSMWKMRLFTYYNPSIQSLTFIFTILYYNPVLKLAYNPLTILWNPRNPVQSYEIQMMPLPPTVYLNNGSDSCG